MSSSLCKTLNTDSGVHGMGSTDGTFGVEPIVVDSDGSSKHMEIIPGILPVGKQDHPEEKWGSNVTSMESNSTQREDEDSFAIHSSSSESTLKCNGEGTNLYVKHLPFDMNEQALKELFSSFGEIDSCKIICDPSTGVSYGYGFVNFVSPNDAMKAIESMNGWMAGTLPLIVKLADRRSFCEESLEGPPNSNLYVKNLTPETGEQELMMMFSPYGTVLHTKVLTDKHTGASRCIGMVKFATIEEATLAKESLNGCGVGPYGSSTLIVKFAETEESKMRRRMKRMERLNSTAPHQASYSVPPNLPQMNGFFSPYGSSGFGHLGYENYFRNYAGIPGVFNGAYPPTINGPTMGNKPPHTRYQPYSTSTSFSVPVDEEHSKHSLFVFHIPASLDDAGIYHLFAPFGALQSAKVIVDKNTGRSKGYGFVNFMKGENAANAVAMMNGYSIDGKYLKVAHKTAKTSTSFS
eukprot:Nk52_evm1s157 gene=Nk52_evmTU1s157